jgi:hypothetical protein
MATAYIDRLTVAPAAARACRHDLTMSVGSGEASLQPRTRLLPRQDGGNRIIDNRKPRSMEANLGSAFPGF